MVANFGPSKFNYDETLTTLRYANRAKNIKNKPRVNEDPKDAMLREFQEEISRLKAQLANVNPKGQLISECLFDVLNFPKNQRKIWQISALESKKWSNHKITAPYSVFKTLNSPYNHSIKESVFALLIWPLFSAWAEICQIFRFFFGKFKTSKRHSEIIWPLKAYCPNS